MNTIWDLIVWFQRQFVLLFRTYKPSVQPNIHLEPTVPKRDFISEWSQASKLMEGWRPGSRSWRNHNPGNLKLGDYTRNFKYISVDAQNFLQFATDADGMSALCQFLQNACEGKYSRYNPEKTLYEFYATYDVPEKAGEYSAFVIEYLKIPATTKIKDLKRSNIT